jgi:2-methylcitrate dehydratase PrpD
MLAARTWATCASRLSAAVLADPADPATYHLDRIGDPALAALQAKVSTTVPDPAFDATYAWKQGARVTVHLYDGRVLERAIHGQRGSMDDPLSDIEIERKFQTLAAGRLDPAIPEAVRSLPERPVEHLTGLLRSGWRAASSQAR